MENVSLLYRSRSHRAIHARINHPEEVWAHWFSCSTCSFYLPDHESFQGHAGVHERLKSSFPAGKPTLIIKAALAEDNTSDHRPSTSQAASELSLNLQTGVQIPYPGHWSERPSHETTSDKVNL